MKDDVLHKGQVMYSEREKTGDKPNYFNEKFKILEDGRIKVNNLDSLTMDDWKIIYTAVNKLGYAMKSVKQTKEVYSRYVADHGFNLEQSEAIMKGFGVTKGNQKSVNPDRVKAAKKHFGTTTDFREAGYLLPDGYMLDFSGKKDGGPSHMRTMDHREISPVFDDGEVNTKYGDATPYMNAFISGGNIRIMDGQGVTIGEIEPSAKQYAVLKKFIEYTIDKEDYFYLDLCGNNGYTIASREYGEGDSASRVINDIKYYFKSDELPYRSELQGYRYSLRDGASADVEKALNDKNYRDDVYLTETSPSIIASQKGVKNLPMLMKASHIRENVFTEEEAKAKGLKVDKHTHYHGLGKELFLQIIDGLDSVNLAYRGTKMAENPARRANYFLLISQYTDKDGNTINVPVYVNETGQYNQVFIDTNKIATVFGRPAIEDYINQEVKKGNLVRIKNRSTQAGERTAVIAAGYGMNASKGNVSQTSEGVKLSDRNTDSP